MLSELLKLRKVGYAHQGEEAVNYVDYFKIICAMGAERRDKGSALFHINDSFHSVYSIR